MYTLYFKCINSLKKCIRFFSKPCALFAISFFFSKFTFCQILETNLFTFSKMYTLFQHWHFFAEKKNTVLQLFLPYRAYSIKLFENIRTTQNMMLCTIYTSKTFRQFNVNRYLKITFPTPTALLFRRFLKLFSESFKEEVLREIINFWKKKYLNVLVLAFQTICSSIQGSIHLDQKIRNINPVLVSETSIKHFPPKNKAGVLQ